MDSFGEAIENSSDSYETSDYSIGREIFIDKTISIE